MALHTQGHALHGPRYAVVLSDTTYNWLSAVVVVPFSTGAKPYEFRPATMINGTRTRALVDQVMAVDKVLLREHVGTLAGEPIMDDIEFYLRDLLGLPSESDW